MPHESRVLLIAPDKFKGTLTAGAAARAIAEGWRGRSALPCRCLPVADGGEGTLEALEGPLGLCRQACRVPGPRGDAVDAEFGITGDRRLAVVELASASGLLLLGAARRDPLRTSTFGTGVLLRAALDAGASSIILAVGGSATCDGGAGLAQALGVRFLDIEGRVIDPPMAGADLVRVHAWLDPTEASWRRAPLVVAVDVRNPLLGLSGAARVFAPQKGADAPGVAALERGLAALVDAARRRGLDADGLASTPGAGAAGGCGFGLTAFLGATLRNGAGLVLESVGFPAALREARLVVTGEGRVDATTLAGKAAAAVGGAAREAGVPAVLIAGAVDASVERALRAPAGPFAEVISLSASEGDERALREPAECLRRAGEALARRWATRLGPS